MPTSKTAVVFVHGWSVTNVKTYGGLPGRLRDEAVAAGIDIQTREVFLGRYISFHDEVRVNDISRAFRTAVDDQLSDLLKDGTRFVCITHSTGAPVIRDWWHRYYETDPKSGPCPMSHLIMLAPANYGSALAQLGKGRLTRIKSWLDDVEPGQGVLDWLELGSKEAWELDAEWIHSDGSQIGPRGVFPFVITGQSIDRKFYDSLNSYTGEIGSDGVVRVASANLNSRYIRLEQEKPVPDQKARKKGVFVADKLTVTEFTEGPLTPLRIVTGKSHSGTEKGIMRSVKEKLTDKKSEETVQAILSCIKVRTKVQYENLRQRFSAETDVVQQNELVEVEKRLFRSDVQFIHDRFSMVIFRVRDHQDHPVTDFDLVLTAGPDDNPNHLPRGFFADRQRNKVNPETITYFFNYDVMKGTRPVPDENGNVIREAIGGAEMLGFRLVPRPKDGFVHYLDCGITATSELLEQALEPNATTLIDIRLRRVVRKNVFRVYDMNDTTQKSSFKDIDPGNEIVE